MEIKYVNSPCGSGKSYQLGCTLQKNINYRIKHKINLWVICLPTIVLAKETYNLLTNLFELDDVKIVNSSDPDTPNVSKAIKEAVELGNETGSLILLVTQKAFSDLAYFPNKKNWIVIVDEVPETDKFYDLQLPENYAFFSNHVKISNFSENLYKIDLINKVDTREYVFGNRDRVKDIVRPALSDLVTSYDGFVDKTAWDKIVIRNEVTNDKDVLNVKKYGNAENKIYILNMLSPVIYDGFKQIVILSANFEDSLLYEWWIKLGIKFSMFLPISDNLRFKVHENGERLSIKCLQEEPWSKKQREQKIGDVTKDEYFSNLVNANFKDEKFLLIHNNDVKEKLDVENLSARLPVICHGLNAYTDYDNMYLGAALNRSPKHTNMLKALGFGQEILKNSLFEKSYQMMSRGSMRDIESKKVFTLITVSKDLGDYIATRFPGASVEMLPGYIPKKTRNKIAMTAAERKAKSRENLKPKQK